jgi:exonuclease III
MSIAVGSSSNWSYPSWPSHLDHILITNELFDEFTNTESSVQTIRIEETLDAGWIEYEKYISDHRPVGLSLKFNP